MKLAIVGSRYFTDYDLFKSKLSEFNLTDIELIISGGAKGADKLAQRYAKDNNIKMKVFEADWNGYGKAAGPRRNTLIVKNCTHLIAFKAKDSIGTLDSIRKANFYKKDVIVFDI